MLRIAVPNKGSLSEPAVQMLREAGYRQRRDPRELVLPDPDNDVEFFFLRPRDVAVYVGQGTMWDYEGLDVTGKIVLVDINQRDDWWIIYPMREAQHPGAAAIVAVDAEERVLLIQQYRHPIRHRDWEIPAGLLDVVGEPPLETARRELAEEVDLVASDWSPLVSIFTTPGGNDEVVHLFLARGLAPAAEEHAREAEEADIRSEWIPLQDAVTGVLEGRLRNGILATGVLAAAERLRRGDA